MPDVPSAMTEIPQWMRDAERARHEPEPPQQQYAMRPPPEQPSFLNVPEAERPTQLSRMSVAEKRQLRSELEGFKAERDAWAAEFVEGPPPPDDHPFAPAWHDHQIEKHNAEQYRQQAQEQYDAEVAAMEERRATARALTDAARPEKLGNVREYYQTAASKIFANRQYGVAGEYEDPEVLKYVDLSAAARTDVPALLQKHDPEAWAAKSAEERTESILEALASGQDHWGKGFDETSRARILAGVRQELDKDSLPKEAEGFLERWGFAAKGSVKNAMAITGALYAAASDPDKAHTLAVLGKTGSPALAGISHLFGAQHIFTGVQLDHEIKDQHKREVGRQQRKMLADRAWDNAESMRRHIEGKERLDHWALSAVDGVIDMAPAMAVSIALGSLTGGVGGTGYWYARAVDTISQSMIEAGADTDTANSWALGMAIPYAAVEKVSLDRWTGRMLGKGVENAVVQKVIRNVSDKLSRGIPGELVKKIGAGGAIKKGAKFTASMLSEAAVQIGQESLQDMLRQSAVEASGHGADTLWASLGEIGETGINEARGVAGTMLLMSALTGGGGAVMQRQRAREQAAVDAFLKNPSRKMANDSFIQSLASQYGIALATSEGRAALATRLQAEKDILARSREFHAALEDLREKVRQGAGEKDRQRSAVEALLFASQRGVADLDSAPAVTPNVAGDMEISAREAVIHEVAAQEAALSRAARERELEAARLEGDQDADADPDAGPAVPDVQMVEMDPQSQAKSIEADLDKSRQLSPDQKREFEAEQEQGREWLRKHAPGAEGRVIFVRTAAEARALVKKLRKGKATKTASGKEFDPGRAAGFYLKDGGISVVITENAKLLGKRTGMSGADAITYVAAHESIGHVLERTEAGARAIAALEADLLGGAASRGTMDRMHVVATRARATLSAMLQRDVSGESEAARGERLALAEALSRLGKRGAQSQAVMQRLLDNKNTRAFLMSEYFADAALHSDTTWAQRLVNQAKKFLGQAFGLDLDWENQRVLEAYSEYYARQRAEAAPSVAQRSERPKKGLRTDATPARVAAANREMLSRDADTYQSRTDQLNARGEDLVRSADEAAARGDWETAYRLKGEAYDLERGREYKRRIDPKTGRIQARTGSEGEAIRSHDLEDSLSWSQQTGQPVAVMITDQRGLKSLNDFAGQDAVDANLMPGMYAAYDTAFKQSLLAAGVPESAIDMHIYGGDEGSAVVRGATKAELVAAHEAGNAEIAKWAKTTKIKSAVDGKMYTVEQISRDRDTQQLALGLRQTAIDIPAKFAGNLTTKEYHDSMDGAMARVKLKEKADAKREGDRRGAERRFGDRRTEDDAVGDRPDAAAGGEAEGVRRPAAEVQRQAPVARPDGVDVQLSEVDRTSSEDALQHIAEMKKQYAGDPKIMARLRASEQKILQSLEQRAGRDVQEVAERPAVQAPEAAVEQAAEAEREPSPTVEIREVKGKKVPVKAAIREATGQVDTSDTVAITERKLNNILEKARARGSREGWVGRGKEVEGMQKELLAAAKEIPAEYRHAVMSAISHAVTPAQAVKALERIDLAKAAAEHKQAEREVAKLWKKLEKKFGADNKRYDAFRKMFPELRDAMRALVAGLDRSKMGAALEATALDAARMATLSEDARALMPERMRRAIERLGKTSIRDLDTADLKALRDVMQMTARAQEIEGTLLKSERAGSKEEASTAAVKSLEKGAVRGSLLERAMDKAFKGTRAFDPKVHLGRGMLRSALHALSRLDTMLTAAERGVDGFLRKFVMDDGIYKGEAEKIRLVDTLRRTVSDLQKKNGLSAGDIQSHFSRLPGKTRLAKLTLGGTVVEIDRGDLATLSMLFDQADVVQEILRSGLEVDTGRGRGRTRRILEGVTLNEMRAVQKAVAGDATLRGLKNMWRELSDQHLLPTLNKEHLRVNGYEIEALPSYFPTKRSKVGMAEAGGETAINMTGAQGLVDTINSWGPMHERTGGSTPLMLQSLPDVISEHIERVSSFAAYAGRLRDIKAVLRDKGVVSAMEASMGIGGASTVMSMVESLTAAEASSGWIGTMMSKAKNRATFATLLHPLTIAKQAASIFGAWTDIDMTNIVRGLAYKSQPDLAAHVERLASLEHSPMLWQRITGAYADADAAAYMAESSVADMFGISTPAMKAQAAAGDVFGVGDRWAIKSIVAGSYLQAQQELGKGVSQAKLDARAVEIAEAAVRGSQPTFNQSDRTYLMGVKGKPKLEIVRFFLGFRSYLAKGADHMIRSYYRGPEAFAKSVTGHMLMGQVAVSLMDMGWRGIRGDEPKEEGWMDWFLGTMARNLSFIPFAGDFVRVVQRRMRKIGPGQDPLVSNVLLDSLGDLAIGSADVMLAAVAWQKDEKYSRKVGSTPAEDKLMSGLKQIAESSRMVGIPSRLFFDLARMYEQRTEEESKEKPKKKGTKRR